MPNDPSPLARRVVGASGVPRMAPCAGLAGRTGLVGLAAVLAACGAPPAPPSVPPAVYVSPVVNDAGQDRRVLSASLRPRVQAELAFRVGGKVTLRAVEVGQSVRAGQVLARLEIDDYELALQAALAQRRAAEVDATQAASDAARFNRLRTDGSVGAADAERQQARADAAAARLAQAERQVALARNRSGYAQLEAPFDGVVTALRFERGQVVGENQPVLTLARPRELELQADIPEALAAELPSWQATARVAGSGGPQFIALRLRELAPSAADTSRTFRARYALQSPAGGHLRMGSTAELVLALPGIRPGAELPVGALLATPAASTVGTEGRLPPSSPNATVWVVDPTRGTLTERPVHVLWVGTDRVRVAGLDDGAWVVSAGAQKLDAGMVVRPVSRPLDRPLPAVPAAAVATAGGTAAGSTGPKVAR